MNLFNVVEYTPSNAPEWDEFVSVAPMGSFLHTRRFLGYHGNRFDDASLLLKNGDRLVAVFPAARDPADPERVNSHPGITFGGLVHTGALCGEKMLNAFEMIREHYTRRGMKSLLYKAIPGIYHQNPSDDDLYALFRIGAHRVRCELSCAIDLTHPPNRSSRRKRGLRKALKAGVLVAEGQRFVPELWQVIEENLERRLGRKPVHTVDEITQLSSLFPRNIKFIVGLFNGRVICGTALFCHGLVTRAQYIASALLGNDLSALDAVIEHAINQSQAENCRYFDFGTSNTDEGRRLSSGVYQFKREFGGGGVAHEYYHINFGA